jgi:nicotinate-nucleotide adenylyltransferase
MFETHYIPSVVSLKTLRDNIGYERAVYFLIGEDSLLSLDTWDNWQELFNLTNFIVALRPGYNLEQMSKTLAHEYNRRLSSLKVTAPYGQIYLLDFKPLDISSTTIRNNIANDLPIENMVDPKVAQYIKDNKLYINNKLC